MKGVPVSSAATQAQNRIKLGVNQNAKKIWTDPQNQRKFFDLLADQFGLKTWEDWYSVHTTDVLKNGGSTLLKYYYKTSLSDALKAVYPEYPWNPLRFHRAPVRFWENITNRRLFFDELAVKLGIRSYQDWYSIKIEDVSKHKALSLVNLYYGGSLSKAVSALYPEHNWEMWRFSSVPKRFWNDIKNVRQYVHWLEQQLGIKRMEDWLSISYDMIPKKTALLQGRTLQDFLAKVYPEYLWYQNQSSKVIGTVSKAQNYLTHVIKKIFPNEEIIVNYRPSASEKDLQKLEYDIFLPNISLALEYQGQHHYGWHYLIGTSNVQQERDNRKKKQSADRNITLIEVPFWWNRSSSSILATIHKYRPDLVPSPPKGAIPIEHALPVQYIKRLAKLKYTTFHPPPKELNPIGKYSMASLSGLRFIFDGTKSICSISGVPITFMQGDQSVTSHVLQMLPSFPVEGVIANVTDIQQSGHQRVIQLNEGHTLDLYIVDIPSMVTQTNEERYNFLMESLQQTSSNIAGVPVTLQLAQHDVVTSKEQLLSKALDWDDRGWGMLLKSPNGVYLESQENVTLMNEDLTYATVLEHSLEAIKCRLTNGHSVTVRTKLGLQYPVDSIVRVKHCGLNSNNEPKNPRIIGRSYQPEDWLSMNNYLNYPYSVAIGGSRSFPHCKTCKKSFEDPNELRLTVKGTYTALNKIPYPTKYYVCMDWNCLMKAVTKYSTGSHPSVRFPVFDLKIGVPSNLKEQFKHSPLYSPNTAVTQPGIISTTPTDHLESLGFHLSDQQNAPQHVLWVES